MPISSAHPAYIGRFAPSPTGPLHAGSLVAALASYLDALAHGGKWLVHIDDADTSRVQSGAAQTILAQLAHYGFVSGSTPSYTQDFLTQHAQALSRLWQARRCYGCACTRADVGRSAVTSPLGERLYAGRCASLGLSLHSPELRAVRLRSPDLAVQFNDLHCGAQSQNIKHAVGDFVLWRPESVGHINTDAASSEQVLAKGAFNYQLTIVCDDHALGVTHVVRGADLLGNTARQLYVYKCLGYPAPKYRHVPVLCGASGAKLSKQHGAAALQMTDPLPYLQAAAAHLGLNMKSQWRNATSVAAFWIEAVRAWEIQYLEPKL